MVGESPCQSGVPHPLPAILGALEPSIHGGSDVAIYELKLTLGHPKATRMTNLMKNPTRRTSVAVVRPAEEMDSLSAMRYVCIGM